MSNDFKKAAQEAEDSAKWRIDQAIESLEYAKGTLGSFHPDVSAVLEAARSVAGAAAFMAEARGLRRAGTPSMWESK